MAGWPVTPYRLPRYMCHGLNARLPLKHFGIPLDAFGQSVVIEHCRMQHLRKAPHLLQRVVSDLSYFRQLGSERRIGGNAFFLCPRQHRCYRSQNLPELIVQLS